MEGSGSGNKIDESVVEKTVEVTQGVCYIFSPYPNRHIATIKDLRTC